MNISLLAELLLNGLAMIALVVVVVAILGPVIRGLRSTELSSAARQARRRSVFASGLAGAAALTVAVTLLSSGRSAVALALTPALVGATCVVVAIVAERQWPRPTGNLRAAALRRPGVGSTSRAMARLAGVGGALSVILVFFGLLTSAPDGRSIRVFWGGPEAKIEPYPGSDFTWPLLIGLSTLALLTIVGLRIVDARPALGPGLEDVDAAARQASQLRVLRGCTFAMLATASGLTATIAACWSQVMSNVRPTSPTHFYGWGWDIVQPLGFAGAIVGIALGILSLKVFLTPGPAMPTEADAQPAAARATVGS